MRFLKSLETGQINVVLGKALIVATITIEQPLGGARWKLKYASNRDIYTYPSENAACEAVLHAMIQVADSIILASESDIPRVEIDD